MKTSGKTKSTIVAAFLSCILLFSPLAYGHYNMRGNFCVYTDTNAYAWNAQTETWHHTPLTGDIQAVVGTEGSFCVVTTETAYVWSSETNLWYPKSIPSGGAPIHAKSSQGNFCVGAGMDAYAWSKDTKIWHSCSPGTMLLNVYASHGNFCLIGPDGAAAWDKETRNDYYTELLGTEPEPRAAFSQGNFVLVQNTYARAWNSATKSWHLQPIAGSWSGVFQFNPEIGSEEVESTASSDLTGDGIVDFVDMAKLADDWLSPGW